MIEDVLVFWFEELTPDQWWTKDKELDQLIIERFNRIHQQAVAGELSEWRITAQGRLAEIIILDQFSRNIYRDTAKMFAQDSLALALAQEAITLKMDKVLTALERSFLYLPFMHSESTLIHQQAVKLFKDNNMDASYQFELKHKQIIDRFERYPHRNEILGRQSTQQEIEFLTQPNSSF